MTKSNKNVSTIISGVLAVIMLIVCAALLVACGPKRDIIEVSSYAELVSALKGDKDTIKLTDDIVVEDVITVTREVTLDLNGKTLSNESPIWVEDMGKWSIISVRANGDLTITGNGTIHALENDCYAFDVIGGGKLVIESGTFIGNISAVYVIEGTVEIKGGEYSIQQLSVYNDNRYTLNCYDTSYDDNIASFVVTGGTFHNFDPANCLAEGSNTNFVAEGYTTQLKADTTDVYEVVIASQE